MKALFSLIFCILCGPAAAQSPETYAYGAEPRQQMDVYRDGLPENAQIIIMLHGGGWRWGDKSNAAVWQAKAAHWVPDGRIFISVNTRLLPVADPVAQARDLARAMTFVQQNARNWGGDPDNIILMGHSAGGHVAALLATRQDIRQAAGLVPWRGTIVLDSAALDLSALMQADPSRLHRNAFGDDPDFWHAASPVAYLGPEDGFFLLVCATGRAGACPAAERFRVAAGNRVAVLPLPLSHRAINAQLGRDNAYTRAVDHWISALR